MSDTILNVNGPAPVGDDLDREIECLENRLGKLKKIERLRREIRQRRWDYTADPEAMHNQLRRILAVVSAHSGISEEQLLSNTRKAEISWARHQFCWLARTTTE